MLEIAKTCGPVALSVIRREVIALAAPPAREKGRVVAVADDEEGARVILDFLKEKKLL